MRLEDLRTTLELINRTREGCKFFSKTENSALIEFINTFASYPNQYRFTSAEILQFIKLTQANKYNNYIQKIRALLGSKNFLLIIDLLWENNCLSKAVIDKLLQMQTKYYKRFMSALENLIQHKLLNETNVNQLIFLVASKLPKIYSAEYTKISRRLNNLERSTIILNSTVTMFSQHKLYKNYRVGGGGQIKKGYLSEVSQIPKYSIKKLNILDAEKALQEARREVRYNHLLNREAYYYSNKNKFFVVASWQTGKPLAEMNAIDLVGTTFAKRMEWLISLLKEVNLFHEKYRVHGDIKNENIILNIITNEMHLIDFGSARKMGSEQTFLWTSYSSDANYDTFDFSDDVYSLGYAVAQLFPALYEIDFAFRPAKLILQKTVLNVHEKAIYDLVKSMMQVDRTYRCTIQDALNYCIQVKNNENLLNVSLLNQMQTSTLKKSDKGAEDVLRGALSSP